MFRAPLPSDDTIGEAWVLSDRTDHQSVVANGSLRGRTIRELLALEPALMLGTQAPRFPRFPLLLKFLDATEMLSVQVHPSDAQTQFLPPGETGKTEAWVVLKAESESRVYAGVRPGTTSQGLVEALENDALLTCLASIPAKPGDAIFLPAGTVHTLGDNLVVFEIQQNSDVTFRLYDWDRLDTKTGRPRPLQVEPALACVDLDNGKGAAGLTLPVAEATPGRERLFACEQFGLARIRQESRFRVGAVGVARVIVCIEGTGQLEHAGTAYPVQAGDVWLLIAATGRCEVLPEPAIVLLEISLPE